VRYLPKEVFHIPPPDDGGDLRHVFRISWLGALDISSPGGRAAVADCKVAALGRASAHNDPSKIDSRSGSWKEGSSAIVSLTRSSAKQ